MDQAKEEKIKMILDELIIDFYKRHITGGYDYYRAKQDAVDNAMLKLRNV